MKQGRRYIDLSGSQETDECTDKVWSAPRAWEVGARKRQHVFSTILSVMMRK